jgi:hypothetical protein
MPTVSKKQEKFMQAVAHSPSFAKKVGVPMSVGREFTKSGGGMANTSRMNRLEELGRVNAEKASTAKGKKNLTAEKKRIVGELKTGMKYGGKVKKMAAGGVAASKMGKVVAGGMKPHGEHTVQKKGNTKGTMVKMAGGGKAKKYC